MSMQAAVTREQALYCARTCRKEAREAETESARQDLIKCAEIWERRAAKPARKRGKGATP